VIVVIVMSAGDHDVELRPRVVECGGRMVLPKGALRIFTPRTGTGTVVMGPRQLGMLFANPSVIAVALHA
jgi:hypothetical protein